MKSEKYQALSFSDVKRILETTLSVVLHEVTHSE